MGVLGWGSDKSDLPKRDREAGKAKIAETREQEAGHVSSGWNVGGRPGRESGGTWGTGDPDRDH